MGVLASKQKIPQITPAFLDEAYKDDLNHAETADAHKSASYAGGFEQEKPSTRIQAIRQYCLWCCNRSSKEVRLCPSTNCSLYPLRFGKRSEQAPSPKRAIRARCKDCSESLGDVRRCDAHDCHLYPYRMGHCSKRVR